MGSERHPEIISNTIVFVGNINPPIFQPAWFGTQGLLKQKEVETTQIEIIRPEITIFKTDWFRLEVTEARFVLGTTDEAYFERLSELAYSTFKKLEHTPVKQMGINLEAHYGIDSVVRWHNFGHLLAPKKIWEKFFSSPGMHSLSIEQKPRPDDHEGRITIKIEPSLQIDPGVFISINDHFEAPGGEGTQGCSEILSIFDREHANSIERSRKMMSDIMEEV